MSLKDRLLDRIATDGPMGVAEYMATCLLDSEAGYYATRDPFGAAGDFTTAPEISQMFGELMGLCLAQCWMDQGRPARFILAELGPGRGTMMRDALRALRSVPGFAPDVVLIEASETLRAIQASTLDGLGPVTWANGLDDLTDAPLFLMANEFFDALPIRQYERRGMGWSERQIGATDTGLTWGLRAPVPEPALAHRMADTSDGNVVEICPALPGIVQSIGDRIARHGGAALIADYGDWRSKGDTFQALKAHQPTDPLDAPGTADLTAHVDFEAIALSAAPAKCTAMTPQGVFLERLGITARAQALAKNLQGTALQSHIAAHRRLTHPEEMGNLFKVVGLYPPDAAPPPGLEP